MFALFYNLYLAMFRGTWVNFSMGDIVAQLKAPLNGLGEFLTSIFGDNTSATLGSSLIDTANGQYPFMTLTAFVLALITSIGIVVMAVKGVKRAFGIFFMGINRL